MSDKVTRSETTTVSSETTPVVPALPGQVVEHITTTSTTSTPAPEAENVNVNVSEDPVTDTVTINTPGNTGLDGTAQGPKNINVNRG